MAKNLQFKVSSALKNIIGRELITDDFIAVFELVKNAFDAYATEVRIIFQEDKLIITDDGKGMDYDDLINKWLFVAYSAKHEGKEDEYLDLDKITDYRDKIESKRFYAGAKGIGRFSCDRLGDVLKLITRRKAVPNAKIEQLTVKWKEFEVDSKEEFININVQHENPTVIEYPSFQHGTMLEISGLNSQWSRKKILKLKHSLEKLINPFDILDGKLERKQRAFSIIIESEQDIEQDEAEKSPRNKVNGPIENFVFETLNVKTTQVRTEIDEKGEFITTELIDRGIPIYKIKERNTTEPKLLNTRYHLFYLNMAAKINFKKQMGVDSVSFGSVFLYRNGFRVYPFGEEGEDSLGLDRRKQQGIYRYLGTRDLIGRIEIIDDKDVFKETSSRDGGLIKTPIHFELVDTFYEKCLKRLENYVVDIQWQIKADKFKEDLSLLDNLDSKTRILRMISKLAESKEIILLDYNKDFLNIIEQKLDETTPEVFKNLSKIAVKTDDTSLIQEIKRAEREYERFRKAAEQTIKEEEAARFKVEEELKQRKAQNLFLKSITSRDFDQVISLVHDIGIYANTIDNYLARMLSRIRKGVQINKEDLISFINKISFQNKKILSFAKFASKSDYKVEEQIIEEDLVSFIEEYIENIRQEFEIVGLNIKVVNKVKEDFKISFKPIEIIIIIDNMLSNSKKAHAKNFYIAMSESTDNELKLSFQDDGKGLDKKITNPCDIFEMGYTTTSGSGLGLFHIRQILDELNGTIEVDSNLDNGVEFVVRIRK